MTVHLLFRHRTVRNEKDGVEMTLKRGQIMNWRNVGKPAYLFGLHMNEVYMVVGAIVSLVVIFDIIGLPSLLGALPAVLVWIALYVLRTKCEPFFVTRGIYRRYLLKNRYRRYRDDFPSFADFVESGGSHE